MRLVVRWKIMLRLRGRGYGEKGKGDVWGRGKWV